jgi:NitT/TauT family transport system permease protein
MKRLVNLQPSGRLRWCLNLLPFLLLTVVYLGMSKARLAENASDPLLPSPAAMGKAFWRLAFEPSRRTGELVLLNDTLASLEHLILGVGISAAIALVFGLLNGGLPLVRATFSPLVTVVSLIPPMAILPVLFIAFGTGETAKIALIAIGVTPFLIRDLEGHALQLPAEQRIKAQTLGANSWQILLRVMLPQLLPRLIASVRLALGTAWLFLIAAEAIAAQEGLGYRIFLVRRYLAMDIILPYVAWITALAFASDWALAWLSRRAFGWYHAAGRGH